MGYNRINLIQSTLLHCSYRLYEYHTLLIFLTKLYTHYTYNKTNSTILLNTHTNTYLWRRLRFFVFLSRSIRFSPAGKSKWRRQSPDRPSSVSNPPELLLVSPENRNCVVLEKLFLFSYRSSKALVCDVDLVALLLRQVNSI